MAALTGTPRSDVSPEDEVRDALARFDRTFAACDGEALAALFEPDAELLLMYSEPLVGRPAIGAFWTRFFATWDGSSWRADHRIVEVHGDHAWSQAVYSETLVHREEPRSREVRGRLVIVLRREPGAPWLVRLVMNSHIRPVEDIPASAPRTTDH